MSNKKKEAQGKAHKELRVCKADRDRLWFELRRMHSLVRAVEEYLTKEHPQVMEAMKERVAHNEAKKENLSLDLKEAKNDDDKRDDVANAGDVRVPDRGMAGDRDGAEGRG